MEASKKINKLLLIVPPQVHLLDISGPAHIFYEAQQYGIDLSMHFVSIDQQAEMESSAGLSFSKLSPFSQFKLQSGDFVFMPGFNYQLIADPQFLSEKKAFLLWLRQQYEQGASICSVCTGAFILGETGILDYKTATTHWKYFSIFKKRFPKVILKQDRLFTIEDRIYCSAGVSSGIDLSLYLIEHFYGAKLAADIAKEVLIYFRRSEQDPQLSVYLQYRNHLDNRIHAAQDYLLSNISQAPTLEEIAKAVNMSSRNLTRGFKKITGITIGQYQERLRAEHATQLLSQGHKVEAVAQTCGLKSPNQLRALLKKYS